MSIKNLICKIRLIFSWSLISEYVDNELDERGIDRVKALIDNCPAANAYYNKLKHIDNAIKAIPEYEPSDSLKNRIDLAIINRDAGYGSRKKGLKWVYALSSVMAILLAVITLTHIHNYRARIHETGMFANLNMYKNMDIYEHMDMYEHMDEIRAISQANQSGY